MSPAVRESTGWLFDLYPVGGSMVLWFLADDGERLRLEDPYQPEVHLEGAPADVDACIDAMERAGDVAPAGWNDRLDFWTGRPRRVYTGRVLRCETWRRALDRHADHHPGVAWYNADLLVEQSYCIERDWFPLMRCRVRHDGRGSFRGLDCLDDRWSPDYEPPPLRLGELSGEGMLHRRRQHLRSLTLTVEGRTLQWDDPREMLSGLQRALDDLDPDVLMTDRGDSFLLPLLFHLARRARFPLRLDRDAPMERDLRIDGRSYMSYGHILYQAPEYSLRGRWHLDRRNSFSIRHNDMDGLFEVARVSRLPVQRIARRSVGTGISAVQIDKAWREGYLVPWKKTYPEGWKTARQLLKTDRGGLVYAPEIGIHENVVELDFVAMYPSIMARYNVSPETVNCPCCNNERVPEIGYTICEKRAGLVSRSLEPIIAKRIEYKARRKAARDARDEVAYRRFDRRQDALKWMLVCCFGYLGYRNARFGRIEAHESVSAYSRELLLRAREVCERHGWHMLHANVDCVWIVKPGFRDAEVEILRREIEEETRLTIALEGIYKWLAFLPSRQVEDRPVPSRYFGVFRDGSLKFRGIEARRSDFPDHVKKAQFELLQELARADSAADYRALATTLHGRIREMEHALWKHEVPLDQLLIRQTLSQDPEDYAGNGMQAIAARQSVAADLNLHAGEGLVYLITSDGDRDRTRRVRLQALFDMETTADPRAYIRLLRRAMNTLLWPAGSQLDEKHILPPGTPPPTPRRRRATHPNPQLDMFAAGRRD